MTPEMCAELMGKMIVAFCKEMTDQGVFSPLQVRVALHLLGEPATRERIADLVTGPQPEVTNIN